MNRLHELAVWIGRIGHCRGFGVQSPGDYRFVRYVINQTLPYYAYSDFDALLPELGREAVKLGKLYFRIANFLQPATVVVHPALRSATDAFLRSGCRSAVIVGDESLETDIDLLIVPATVSREDFAVYEDYLTPRSVVVIDRLYKAKATWKRLLRERSRCVSYDLYYAGILFMDPKRYKQDYIINF